MQGTKENLNNKCHCSKRNLWPVVEMRQYSQHVSFSFLYSLEFFPSAIITHPAVFQLTSSKRKKIFLKICYSSKNKF